MTYGPGWPPPPPPPPPPPGPPRPPRQYAPKWIWVGVAVGIVVTIGLPALGFLLGNALEVPGLPQAVFTVGILAPLVAGITFTAIQGSPARKGFGLGMIIGWGLSPIVFAGVCTIILIGAYAQLQGG